MKKIAQFINAITALGRYLISTVPSGLTKFAKEKPGQIFAPIGVLICSILALTIADDTIFEPILTVIQFVLIIIQFRSIHKTIKANRKDRIANEKIQLQDFFESAGPNGIPGSIQFLSQYTERWYLTLYYKIRGITRLTLFQFGADDIWGSYTKIPVTKKQLFHLRLKDCIGTTDPQRAVDAIKYIRDQQLTQQARDAIISVQYTKET